MSDSDFDYRYLTSGDLPEKAVLWGRAVSMSSDRKYGKFPYTLMFCQDDDEDVTGVHEVCRLMGEFQRCGYTAPYIDFEDLTGEYLNRKIVCLTAEEFTKVNFVGKDALKKFFYQLMIRKNHNHFTLLTIYEDDITRHLKNLKAVGAMPLEAWDTTKTYHIPL